MPHERISVIRSRLMVGQRHRRRVLSGTAMGTAMRPVRDNRRR